MVQLDHDLPVVGGACLLVRAASKQNRIDASRTGTQRQ